MQARITIVISLVAVLATALAVCSSSRLTAPTGEPLNASEDVQIHSCIRRMQNSGLGGMSLEAAALLSSGVWQDARPGDIYLKMAEKAGDTPFAYTLSNGHHPYAIVLGPKFWSEATDIGRTAVMLHEMGHYDAYVKTGRSDEYDGYRREFDTHRRIGLSDKDGLVYFAMLDGVVQYVVPRSPVYGHDPAVKAFASQ